MKIADFADAARVLDTLIPPPIERRSVYNLETMRALMEFLGQPQDTLRVIHVAGTSGKTSTAYYVAALLKAAGKKTGLTVSPHIVEMNERVQIDLTPLPEREFCDELGLFLDEVQHSGTQPTYFEILIAFAYWEFVRQQVDYAVVEVGLGGLLDGTNVVSRADKICVITDIGFDHMQVLGSTLPEITAQKAGIIQDYNPVFMHEQSRPVMEVVRRVCQAKQGELRIAADAPKADLTGLPTYQRRNMTLAMAVAGFALARDDEGETAGGRPSLDAAAVARAAHTHIPARMEAFKIGAKTIILDGAHNPQKLEAMAGSLRAQYPNQKCAALIGFIQTKEVALPENASIIHDLAARIFTTGFPGVHERAADAVNPETIAAACRAAGANQVRAIADREPALKALLASPEPLLLVTGSLYLISYVRPLIVALAANRP